MALLYSALMFCSFRQAVFCRDPSRGELRKLWCSPVSELVSSVLPFLPAAVIPQGMGLLQNCKIECELSPRGSKVLRKKTNLDVLWSASVFAHALDDFFSALKLTSAGSQTKRMGIISAEKLHSGMWNGAGNGTAGAETFGMLCTEPDQNRSLDTALDPKSALEPSEISQNLGLGAGATRAGTS